MSGGFCQFCGKPSDPEARFCAACGKPLPADSAPRAAQSAGGPEEEVFDLRPLVVRTALELFVCVLTLGVAWVVYWFARMGVRYRVTSERIETREGVFTRRSQSVELFRIEDFEVQEPFFLRMRGAGNLIVRTMDKDESVAELVAIPGVREVYEKLRTLTRDERARKGVRVVERG